MPRKSRRRRIRKSKEFIRVRGTRRGSRSGTGRGSRRVNKRHHNGGTYDDTIEELKSDAGVNFQKIKERAAAAATAATTTFEQFTKNAKNTFDNLSSQTQDRWYDFFSKNPSLIIR